MTHTLPAVVLLATMATASFAQTTKYDGDWSVTLACPPHKGSKDDAEGYTHHFAGKVANGELSATRGTEGEEGWHFLRGTIKPNGEALLRLEGIVKSSDHAINNAPRGKRYTYRVKAQFDESSGTGQRVSGRVCDFKFVRS